MTACNGRAYSALRVFAQDLNRDSAVTACNGRAYPALRVFVQDLNRDSAVTASNGRAYPALRVFAHALRYFKDHVLAELQDQSGTRVLAEDVRWVLTVPAIWKASAKQFMRQAAYEVSRLTVTSTLHRLRF